MILDFSGKVAKDIWQTNLSKSLPREYRIRAKALLTIIHATSTLDDLRFQGEPPDIGLHKLKGNRKSYWSITINLPWCITFQYTSGKFSEVKIENHH